MYLMTSIIISPFWSALISPILYLFVHLFVKLRTDRHSSADRARCHVPHFCLQGGTWAVFMAAKVRPQGSVVYSIKLRVDAWSAHLCSDVSYNPHTPEIPCFCKKKKKNSGYLRVKNCWCSWSKICSHVCSADRFTITTFSQIGRCGCSNFPDAERWGTGWESEAGVTWAFEGFSWIYSSILLFIILAVYHHYHCSFFLETVINIIDNHS